MMRLKLRPPLTEVPVFLLQTQSEVCIYMHTPPPLHLHPII